MIVNRHPDSIQKLIDIFSKFPTVGPRTAARFVFYLTRFSPEQTEELINSIKKMRESVRLCSSCFNPFESEKTEQVICSICQDPSRDKSLLCIVEKEADLSSIENTKRYKGLYFVLSGTVGLKKEKSIKIEELKEKIKNGGFKEIIIAINPTSEGETTSLFLERELKMFNIKTTRLGRGLPIGGELEYADDETLSSAFDGRK
jgi:recombination protein RecR